MDEKNYELMILLLPYVMLSSIIDKNNSFMIIYFSHRIKSYIKWL